MPDLRFIPPQKLDLALARELAGSLITMGHPSAPAAIDGTARDLIEWCGEGVKAAGVLLPAERAARALVNEARRTWDGWPKEGGTKQLLALFHKMYDPPVDPDAQKREWERKYGPPNPSWSRKLVRKAVAGSTKDAAFKEDLRNHMEAAIRDSLYYTEGKGRFDFEEVHGDNEETRRRKRESEAFWTNAIKEHNKNHPEEVARIRAAITAGELPDTGSEIE